MGKKIILRGKPRGIKPHNVSNFLICRLRSPNTRGIHKITKAPPLNPIHKRKIINGISVGEMNLLFWKEIEDLTLLYHRAGKRIKQLEENK